MSYNRTGARRPDGQLGWVQAIPIAISTYQSIAGLFSGGPSLADRIKTRIVWTVQMAQQGSTLAAAIIAGGAHESSVDAAERAAWAAVASQVPETVADAARESYPNGYWPVGQPDFYSDTMGATHQRILREVQAATASNSPPPSQPLYGTTAQGLPAVTTTAPYNWTPVIIAGAAGLFLLSEVLAKPNRRGRR